MQKKHYIAIFASGAGSNARKIIEYFQGHESVRIALVVSNRKEAGVLGIAREYGIPTYVTGRAAFYETEELLAVLTGCRIDFVVLAGFLWLIPPYLVQKYRGRMINIHPALLPKYGGQGMYGMHVHEAVKAAGEQESGITIHYVNEHYDEGDSVFQASCALDPGDTPAEIAHKVQLLEHQHFAPVIEKLVCARPESLRPDET